MLWMLACISIIYRFRSFVQVIDILLKYVNQARSALNHASEEKLFPLKARDNKVCQTLATISSKMHGLTIECCVQLFNPELPDDLVVEFFISEVFVVCKVSALQYHANVPIASAVAKFSLLGGPKPANKMVYPFDSFAHDQLWGEHYYTQKLILSLTSHHLRRLRTLSHVTLFIFSSLVANTRAKMPLSLMRLRSIRNHPYWWTCSRLWNLWRMRLDSSEPNWTCFCKINKRAQI